MGLNMIRELEKLLASIRRRIALLLARGSVHLSKSSAPHQRLQLELVPGEILDNVEHFEAYGLTANPLIGAEVIAASLAGDRTRAIVLVAADRRYRKKNLAAGEVALYTDEGDYILLKRGRIVEVVAGTKVQVTAPDVEVIASTKVTLTSPLVAISGDLTVGGYIAAQSDVTAGAISLQNHRHGGVVAGGAMTGLPQ